MKHPLLGGAAFVVACVLSSGCESLSGLSGAGGDGGKSQPDGGKPVVDGGKHDAADARGKDSSLPSQDSGTDARGTARDSAAEASPPADGGACASPVAGGTAGVLVLAEFCIDSTEAPVALYEHFLNDIHVNPASGQPPECSWNTSYEPFYDPYAGNPQRAAMPQTAVNWCDALAYCKYWGKHLCGNRLDGGALDPSAPLEDGQWYTACTNGTGQTYPYGDSYEPTACRSALAFDAGAAAVPTSPTCQGGVSGLFDMSGNVQEWENSCIPSGADAATDSCVSRGGTWFFPSDSVTCALNSGGAIDPRNLSDTNAQGIRCCWEPP